MLCLPTPQGENGRLDTSALDDFFLSLNIGERQNNRFVIRSTVPVGYTESVAKTYKVDVCHSPEFLTARCAELDAMLPGTNFVGRTSDCAYAHTSTAQRLVKLYTERFPGTLCQIMTSETSEFLKLMKNAFFAAKISLFNEFKEIALHSRVDWTMAVRGVITDGRINPSHTNVPGPDGRTGFGGACLPKDLKELLTFAEGRQIKCPILTSVDYRNSMIDRPNQVDRCHD